MKKLMVLLLGILIVFATVTFTLAEGEIRFADLGDFPLENGEKIRDCRIGYRTFGTLNQDKSNGLLFPTWLAGSTQDLVDLGFIGPGKLADTSKYFVIAVDVFGNGVSSSPSNSKAQPGRRFPGFSVRDMVNAQYTLLTRHLQVPRLYAVVGISLGGMQAFQWIVSYPGFAEKAVPISGTPQPTSYDLLLWRSEIDAIENATRCGHDNSAAMARVGPIHALFSRTPDYFDTHTKPEKFPEFLVATEKSLIKYNAEDWASQVKAVMSYDIYRHFGGSQGAAKAVKSQVLVVTGEEDRMVYPVPAVAFAALLNAETYRMPGNCGHLSFLCEQERLRERVNRFLSKTGR